MDGRSNKESESAKQPPDIPLECNKSVPIGLVIRELGHRKKQGTVPLEFQAAAEDILVSKQYEELRCELPGASRSTFLMVFSPDGKKVASTHGNHNVYVTDLTTGKNVNTLSGHPRTPWCIAFHPSSNQILASGCLGGQVRVWDLHGGSEMWMADGQTVIASLAFHPTDRLLVIATYNELHFWDWSQPEPFTKCYTNNEKEKVRYVAFDQLGHKLITGISNAPHVQTQWDRVTATPPNSQSTSSASTSHSSPTNPNLMPPERERRITICYRSLVEQYEQLVQRYFDLSRSRTIPTMDRGTDPMDLEAEASTSGSRPRDGAGSSGKRRESGLGASNSNPGGSNSSNSSSASPSNIRMREFPSVFNIVPMCPSRRDSPAPNVHAEQGTGNRNSTTEPTQRPPSPEYPLNVRILSYGSLRDEVPHLNSTDSYRPGPIAPPSRAQGPSSDANNLTRDVGVGPADNRLRVHIRAYEVTQTVPQSVPQPVPSFTTFSYTRRPATSDPNTQAPVASESQRNPDPNTEGSWQQRCLFSRLHSQAQPASPVQPERLRRFFVSQRSAFQPRTPRMEHVPTSTSSEPQTHPRSIPRYLFRRRGSNAGDPLEYHDVESETLGPGSPPTPMQRARMDMTDVGVRYGIQLLSRHIDNMQRLCRARLEILQLQQIRRMWEDLQRQIRSLHVAVRESTIALTGTSESLADGNQFGSRSGSGEGSSPANSNRERPEGLSEANGAHIPSVSQMMELARISDNSPGQDSSAPTSSAGPFTLSQVRNLIRLQQLKQVQQSVAGSSGTEGETSQTNSVNTNIRNENGNQQNVNSESTISSESQTNVLSVDDSEQINTEERDLSVSLETDNCEERTSVENTSTNSIQIENELASNRACDSETVVPPESDVPKETHCTGSLSTSANNNPPQTSGEAPQANVGQTPLPVPGTSGSRPSRGGFWLVSTMNLTQPVPTRNSTTSTAGSPAITTPSGSSRVGCSSSSSSSMNCQLLQQRLWRISRKVYLRRPRLFAVAQRSLRRQLSGNHSSSSRNQHSGLFRHSDGNRRPWFMQSSLRPQRRSTNTASQVESSNPAGNHDDCGTSHDSALHDSSQPIDIPVSCPDNTPTNVCTEEDAEPGSSGTWNPMSNVTGDQSWPSSPSDDKTEMEVDDEEKYVVESNDAKTEGKIGEEVPKQNEQHFVPASTAEVNVKTEHEVVFKEGASVKESSAQDDAKTDEHIASHPSTSSETVDTLNNNMNTTTGSTTTTTTTTASNAPTSTSTTTSSSSQPETSTSESLRAMIVRLERLVQQQREQREQLRSERLREAAGQSRRTNMWGLREGPPWFRSEINSGSDSDSNPETERSQSWGRLSAEERLTSALQNEVYGNARSCPNTSGSRRSRSNPLDQDWEWTRESTRLRARQVLSLMVESLTQFFEENGLSNNTPHAVLDEQIYNLYVLLQLALELTDLLLAQLVSTRRELEHQWVHRLRSPVALDASMSGEQQSVNRDQGERGRGRQDNDMPPFSSPPFRRLFRHRLVPCETDGASRPDRGSGRGRGECSRRLSSRMMNCLARHSRLSPHSTNTHSSGLRSGRGLASRALGRVMLSRGEGSSTAGRIPNRASPGTARRNVPTEGDNSSNSNSSTGPGGIMVRVQQYQTPPNNTPTSSSPNTPTTQQHDAFTVPLVRVNDILIPDTSILNQPRTRPQSPPPHPNSPFRNPFSPAAPPEQRVLGPWPDLWPYVPGSSWRPRFLHPRYVGPNFFNDEQDDVLPAHPGENFNFIRGNSIVPDTVIITDAPMSPNHRIQVWDFSKCNIPDISNAEKNVIVPECRIHNDASVDVSKDGRLLVTLLPSGRLSMTTKLGVYSLEWESLGQCLYTTSFDQSAVSVSLSPASRHLLVGLATRRVALLPNDRQTMAQIFRLEGARPSRNTDGRGRSNGNRGRLCHLRDIEQLREQGYMSLNCIRWAPGPGQGFVYGTNTGQLKVLR